MRAGAWAGARGVVVRGEGVEISFCKRGEEGREDEGRQGGTRWSGVWQDRSGAVSDCSRSVSKRGRC
jgi:rubredoxin